MRTHRPERTARDWPSAVSNAPCARQDGGVRATDYPTEGANQGPRLYRLHAVHERQTVLRSRVQRLDQLHQAEAAMTNVTVRPASTGQGSPVFEELLTLGTRL